MPGDLAPSSLTASPEGEVNCSQEAKGGPEKIEFDGLAHVEDRKGDKHGECDHFLENFELRQCEGGVTDAIGGDLERVFKEGDAPAYDGGPIPGFCAPVFEMSVPGESHEGVGTDQE